MTPILELNTEEVYRALVGRLAAGEAVPDGEIARTLALAGYDAQVLAEDVEVKRERDGLRRLAAQLPELQAHAQALANQLRDLERERDEAVKTVAAKYAAGIENLRGLAQAVQSDIAKALEAKRALATPPTVELDAKLAAARKKRRAAADGLQEAQRAVFESESALKQLRGHYGDTPAEQWPPLDRRALLELSDVVERRRSELAAAERAFAAAEQQLAAVTAAIEAA